MKKKVYTQCSAMQCNAKGTTATVEAPNPKMQSPIAQNICEFLEAEARGPENQII